MSSEIMYPMSLVTSLTVSKQSKGSGNTYWACRIETIVQEKVDGKMKDVKKVTSFKAISFNVDKAFFTYKPYRIEGEK